MPVISLSRTMASSSTTSQGVMLSRLLVSRVSLTAHLLYALNVLLVIYIARSDAAWFAIASFIPLGHTTAILVLGRVVSFIRRRRGSSSLAISEWLGPGSNEDEGWLGSGDWLDGIVGGTLTGFGVAAFVESFVGLTPRTIVSVMSLAAPVSLFRSPSSPYYLPATFLFFVSSFSLLAFVDPTDPASQHRRMESLLCVGTAVACRVAAVRWCDSGRGRRGGGRKGELVAVLTSSALLAAFHRRIPDQFSYTPAGALLVLSSVIAALSNMLDPILISPLLPSNGTHGGSPIHAILGSLVSPFQTTLIFATLAACGLASFTNIKLALMFSMATVGGYVLLASAMISSRSTMFPLSDAEVYEVLPVSLGPTKYTMTSDDEGIDIDPTPPPRYQSPNAPTQTSLNSEDGDEADADAIPNKSLKLIIGLLSILPLLLWLGGELRGPLLTLGTMNDTGGAVRGLKWARDVDFDLAIAYYNEPVDTLQHTIEQVKSTLPENALSRVIIYAKGPGSETQAGLRELLKKVDADEVVALPNVGREGETYLQHIVRHHSNPVFPLARQTYFLQPHLAWEWVAVPRLETVHPNTGFISFGPYLNASCRADGSEIDSAAQEHARIGQIYSAFRGDLCPPEFLITWAGQFLVSRKRILQTSVETYANLLEFFDVPKGQSARKDWIWQEGWWNNEPDNPTLGHALERSWPIIFDCADPSPVWNCPEDRGPGCECRDE